MALPGLSWGLPTQTPTRFLADKRWPLARIEAALETEFYVNSLIHPLTHIYRGSQTGGRCAEEGA